MLAVGLNTNSLGTLKDNLLNRGRRNNRQILRNRSQQVIGCRPKSLAARVDQDRHAKRVARVVVRVERETSLLKEIQHRREVLLPLAGVANVQRTRAAVVFGLGGGILGVDASREVTVERLECLEARLDLIPTVRVVTDDTRPLLVVITGTDRVDAKVDGARTA